MSTCRLSVRIDLPNGARLGPGKIALLEAVGRRRSISAAARDLDMSYRRAWLLIDNVNRSFAEPAVENFPGRSQGAGAALTPFGERLIALYRAVERRAARSASAALSEITAASDSGPGAAAVSRPRRRKDASGE